MMADYSVRFAAFDMVGWAYIGINSTFLRIVIIIILTVIVLLLYLPENVSTATHYLRLYYSILYSVTTTFCRSLVHNFEAVRSSFLISNCEDC